MKWLTLNDGSFSKTKIISVLTAAVGLALALGVKIPAEWTDPERIGGIVTTIIAILSIFHRQAADDGPTK